jgi:hypothetical protein
MIEAFVFSYNRGRYLQNLLRSAKECGWPGRLTIIDDRSEDPVTCRVLATAQERFGAEVIVPENKNGGKYGGFWANMELAFSQLAADRFVMFLQDDLQFVRPVTQSDVDRVTTLAADSRLSPFVYPSFWWGARGKQEVYRTSCSYSPEFDTYHWSEAAAQPGFSDVAIFDRQRLVEAGWRAGRSETESNADAHERFGVMTLDPSPFVAFVPFAPRFRGGQAWSRRLDLRRSSTPAAFRIMNAQENAAFVRRDRDSLPIAADHLTISGFMRRQLLRNEYWES